MIAPSGRGMRRESRRRGRTAARLAAVLCVVAPRLAAQGTVAGTLRDRESARPIPYALVKLARDSSTAGPLLRVLADSAGAFVFRSVPAGTYRASLERMGYAASAVALRVSGTDTARVVLDAQPVAIQLPALSTAPACYTEDTLDQAPELALLWRGAMATLRTQAALENQYRFRFTVDGQDRGSGRIGFRTVESDSVWQVEVVNGGSGVALAWGFGLRRAEADSVRAKMFDAVAQLFGGREQGIDMRDPTDRALLAEGFLRASCLQGEVQQLADGAVALRFRPVARPRRGVGVAGTITLEAGSYALRSVTLESLLELIQNRAEWRYADVTLPAGLVRVAVRAEWRMKVAMRLVNLDFSSVISRRWFRDFAPARL